MISKPLIINIFCIIWSCFILSCTNTQVQSKNSALCTWLSKPQHVNLKNYKDTFITRYQLLIANDSLNEAASLLDAYGKALDLRFEYDSFYVGACKNFMKTYENKLGKFYKIALNYYLGSQLDFNSEWDSSNIYLKKAYAVNSDDKSELKVKGFAGILLGNHLLMKEKTEEALKQFLLNLKLFETLKDSVNQATSMLDIASVYKRLKMYDQNKQYLLASIPLSIAKKDTQNLWKAYNNLARPNELEANKDTCLHYAKKTKSLFDAWSRKTDFFSSHTNYIYGQGLFLNNYTDSALWYFKIAKATGNNYNLKMDIIVANAALNKKINLPQNIIEIEDALKQAVSANDVVNQGALLDILAVDAYNKKKYKDAHDFILRKYSLRDSAWIKDTKIEVANLDKKYQVAKKEKTIAEQKNKIAALLFFTIGIGLASTLFFVYQKRKEAQAETQRQQIFTMELLQNTEAERKRIATDLHDGVNHELLALKIEAHNGRLINSAAIEKIINEVRQVSRNLYPVMFERVGLLASIEALCERMTEAGLFTTSEISYAKELSKSNELQLYRIIQEALNNALKHAKANAAKVTINTVGTEIVAEIKDNGNGFNTFEKMNSANSFGLITMSQRARSMGGKSIIKSGDKGTNILIKTPIK